MQAKLKSKDIKKPQCVKDMNPVVDRCIEEMQSNSILADMIKDGSNTTPTFKPD